MKHILVAFLILLVTMSCNSSSPQSKNNSKHNLITSKILEESINDVNNRNNFSNYRINQIPNIDGVINKSEWYNSSKYKLYGGDSIYFIISDDTLFIAIRGNSGGFTSLGFSNGSQLKILHSSTGLITAEYVKNNAVWQLVYDFKEPRKKSGKKHPRNNERLGNDYKKSQVKQFGWYANLIEMGNPSETEFMIPLSSLPNGDLNFSIVFYQIKSKIKKAKFPENLADAMLNQGLISGSAIDNLNFKVETWFSLKNIYNN